MRRRWPELKPQLQRGLLDGQCRFQPLRRIRTDDGECIELWAALDALVLKALAMVLNRRLDFPRSCYHVPGKEGEGRRVVDLVGQCLHRTVEENCLYTNVTCGISLGCPLWPVMAAIYLEPLDRHMEATGLTYARFMDDWVILAPTRWALRRAVRIVKETLSELRVEQHTD